jgi:hypothetical protein
MNFRRVERGPLYPLYGVLDIPVPDRALSIIMLVEDLDCLSYIEVSATSHFRFVSIP